MSSGQSRPPFTRIIVEENIGHWTARFENVPNEGWGGDTPGTAVERLWEAHLNTLAARGDTPSGRKGSPGAGVRDGNG